MFSYDGKIFKVMEVIGNFCFLNIIWLIFSLPIITIPASTSAMLGVMKELSEGNEPSLAKVFYRYFKKHFKQASIVGVFQFLIGIVLVVDLLVMWNLEGIIRYITLSIFGLFVLMFLFMSFYIYPLIVDFEMSYKELIKKSFYLSITRPATPIIILLFISIIVFICTFVPFLPILCAFSMISFINYYICKRTISKFHNFAI
ncbi:YesL family protein [Bacillus sp. JJ1562]|uniref:YesL family protein n=1 Tax=Bacillus sp. JJ1562 TaxID=3122960 RepID=UPI003F689F44